MRFYEFEAKQLLRRYRVPLPESRLARTADEAERAAAELEGPVVLKSQVLSGGRMKAGGVKFADTPAEARQAAGDILALEISGLTPVGVLVEQRRNVEQEYYAAVTWDTRAKSPVIVFSDMGGIDIEEVAEQHPQHLTRVQFSVARPFSDFQAKVAVSNVGITGGALNALSRIVAALARAFVEHDLTLAEINPIGRLDDGSFVALDSHMDMEDDARDSHAELLRELGIPDDEIRRARPADGVRDRRRGGRRLRPARRRRQCSRVRRRPGADHRRRRRLADALRRRTRGRRATGELLRDRRQPLGR